MPHSLRTVALALFAGAGTLTTAQAQTQVGFQPGYVLSLSGDTLRGSVNNRQWDVNPKAVEFRPASGPTRTYRASTLRGFQVGGEQYEGAVVQVDGSPYLVRDLTTSTEFKFRQDTVFVRALVTGPKSLYYYKDYNDKEHFFIRRNDRLELLIFKQFLRNNTVASNKGYIGQLQLYLADCPAVASRLREAAYTERSLVEAFAAYQACVAPAAPRPVYQPKGAASRLEFGVLAGLSATTLWTYLDYAGYGQAAKTTKYATDVRPAAGISLDFTLPRRLQHFAIGTELLYVSNRATDSYSYYENADNYTKGEIKLDYGYAKLNGLLRYRRPLGSGATAVFVSAGGSVGYAVKDVHTRRETTYFYGRETVRETAAFGGEEELEESYLAGAGLRYKHLSGEVRYERGTGIINSAVQSSKTHRLYFLLGYRF